MSAITTEDRIGSERARRPLVRLATRLGAIDWRISGLLIGWIAGLWLLAWAGSAAMGMTSAFPPATGAAVFLQQRDPLWQYIWTRWDGQWYLNIAYGGYGTIPDDAPFFPMYPMLTGVVHWVTGLPYAGAGILVSYVCLALGLVYLYKLVRLDFERDIALRTIILTVLYPTAFFFLAVYTESLVLFLLTAALYYARVGKWWPVAVLAFALGLTKVASVALGAALLCEILLGPDNSPLKRLGRSWREVLRPRVILARLNRVNLTALLAGPVALLCYMAYLQWRFGDALVFISVLPSRFWRGREGFIDGTKQMIGGWFDSGFTADNWPKFGDLLAFVLLLVLAIYLARRIRLSYALLILAFLATVVQSGDTNSLNRYILTLSPAFIGMTAATRRTPRAWIAMLVVFAAIQAYFALRFFLWQWVD